MQLRTEGHYVAGWAIYLIVSTLLAKLLYLASVYVSAALAPSTSDVATIAYIASVALTLMLQYVLFRTIVRRYLCPKTRENATPTI